MHLGMLFTNGGARIADGTTRFRLKFEYAPIRMRLAHKRLCRGAADFGTIKVHPDTIGEVMLSFLCQTGVGAGSTGSSADDACPNTMSQFIARHRSWGRMGAEHPANSLM